MSSALTVASKTAKGEKLTEIQRLGNILSASGYFADVKDAAQAAVKVMAGEELGIGPVASVMGIHIIKGKVTLSANLIAAQVRKHGYDYEVKKLDEKGCEIIFLDKKGNHIGASRFDESDAKNAGCFSDMYKKFPRNMYFSRAMSNGAKWYCPEVTSGLPVYVPEEIGAKVDGEGNFIEEQPTGSKEAAARVAEQKLNRMKAGETYQEASAAVTEDLGVSSDDIAPVLEASIRKVEADKFRALEAFKVLKKEIIDATGSDKLYYAALESHGYKKSNQIPTPNMRAVYKVVAQAFTEWRLDHPVTQAEVSEPSDEIWAEVVKAYGSEESAYGALGRAGYEYWTDIPMNEKARVAMELIAEVKR